MTNPTAQKEAQTKIEEGVPASPEAANTTMDTLHPKRITNDDNLFGFGDNSVCAESNARYIFVILDDKDRRLLMMMVLPHVREHVIKDGKLVAKAVAELIDFDVATSVKHSEERIKRLCLIGAIVFKHDIGWVPNPKLVSQISQRAT